MTHKIMVVDDNAATRRMVKTALARHGHEVIEAPDGRTARELMVRESPVLVLQDLMLPDADGFELVGELRELAKREVVILAFSGFVSKLDEARVSSVGFDDIIPKPIAPSRLVPIVEAHLPNAAAAAERFGTGHRVVLVDDDPLQIKLAAFRLTRLGFEVATAPDGAAALDMIRRAPPHVVVSDVIMPDLDGFGLAMALRHDPALRALPLVLVTSSYIEPADRELARKSGANELVPRTAELVELVAALRNILEGPGDAVPIVVGELPQLERERTRRVLRQLERQVMLNAGLAKRCSSLASELTVLAGIAEAVLRDHDVEAALDDALATCFDAGGIAAGALYMLDANGALRARPLGAEPPDDVATFFGREQLLRETIASGRPLVVPSADTPPALADELLARARATALLVMPLAGASAAGALLMIARSREIDPDDWRAFAIGVGAQLGQALALARAYSDREAAERLAGQHAALLAAIVEHAPDTLVLVDRDGTVRFVNAPVRGLPVDRLIGTSFFALLPADEAAAIRAAFESVIETGQASEYETRGARADGSAGAFSVRLGPVKEAGRVDAVIVVARDVTEKKQTEMQLMFADRMASVGTLAAGIAHEINNPLASIIANLDMAIDEVASLAQRVELPADLGDELRDARASADRVREIVRDVKIFSRAEDDRRGAVDVEKVLESTLRMAWNELRHRAKVERVYAKVPAVEANESRLGQVFLNLIVNAAHAIPEGNYEGNRVRVATEHDRARERVVVSIADTGGGIPPDVQARLFTPFFTTKPAGVGTGLGLAISQRIVTSLGGTIELSTEVGRGSEFRVVLPVAATVSPSISQRMPTARLTARRGRVLVVDDEDSLVQAIRRFLARDHDVTAVTRARAALDLLVAGERFDVILCDLMMPQVTGMELHAELARLDAAQAGRVVFLTGGAFTAAAREFLDTTKNRRLDKPFDFKALRELVNRMVE